MNAEKIYKPLRHVLAIAILSATVSFGQTTASRSDEHPRMIEGVAFARDANLLNLTPEQQPAAYRNLRFLAPHNTVARGPAISPLPAAPMDFREFTYKYLSRARTLEDFIADTRVAGILVIKDGRVVLERYARRNGPASVWTSFSVAKSVLSLLFGAAVKDGSIKSLDDTVTQYVPRLRGSAYDRVTLRHLLQMSSGVAWNEDETDPASDLSRFASIGPTAGIEGQLDYMKRLPRKAPPGTVFNYNTGETNVAGAVLQAAIRQPLAEYLSEKLWKPAGMEADAYWLLVRGSDMEFGGCCISATLRDYGRLGLLALRDGATADGERLLPDGWMAASTKAAPAAADYGYLWWLEGDGRYAASGIFGQYIYVVPGHNIVVAIHSAWPVAYNKELPAHRRAFLNSLAAALSGKHRGRR